MPPRAGFAADAKHEDHDRDCRQSGMAIAGGLRFREGWLERSPRTVAVKPLIKNRNDIATAGLSSKGVTDDSNVASDPESPPIEGQQSVL